MNSIQSDHNTDHNLFNKLFQDNYNKIYRLAGKFFSDQADREDVVQETFLRIYRYMHHLESEDKNHSGWVYRIGTNICIDMIRRRKSRNILYNTFGDPNEFIEVEPSTIKNPEQEAISSEVSEQLQKIIEELPHKWRPFIYQRYILDMSIKEISIANQMPINTVKSRIHRALNHLQRVLSKSELLP